MKNLYLYSGLLFLTLWLSLQALGTRFLLDPGTFWHITTGHKIINEGFINQDPYTFTFPQSWWIPYQWLGEVIMNGVHEIGGMDSVLTLSTALAAGLLTWISSRFYTAGLHPIFSIGLILLALAAIANHLHARPLIATMIAMVALMTILMKVESREFSIRAILYCVPMFILWTNIHGGVVGGLATLYLAVAGWIISYGLGYTSPVTCIKDALQIIFLSGLCTMTVFVNPYGFDLPKTWLLILKMPKLPELIIEHARYQISDSRGWPMLGVGFVYLFCLSGLRVRPRVTWLIPLAWFIQALLRVRHGSLFTLVSMVVLVDIWKHTRWAQWLHINRPDVFAFKTFTGNLARPITITASVCFTASLLLQSANLRVPLIGSGSAQFDSKHWPMEILDALKEHEPRSLSGDRNIFNDYSDGGFIIYHTPGYRVFVDDRCEVFGDDWLEAFVRAGEDYDRAKVAIPLWEKEYGQFRFALTRTDTEFNNYFQNHPEQWKLIKKTDVACFYRRY